jgi:hypothetical protein
MTTENTNKPVHRIRYGHVAAAIWVANSQSGCFYQTMFERVFKSDGQWSSSFSFDDRDLPALAKAASDAHSWIHERKANAVTVEGKEPEPS